MECSSLLFFWVSASTIKTRLAYILGMKNIDSPRILRVDNLNDSVLVEFEGDSEIVAFPSWLLHVAKDLARIMAESDEVETKKEDDAA